MHHFKAAREFKLELQSGNAQFGSQSAVFCLVWPWNLIDALKNNRAPLLCYCKLCASFHSHLWNQTEVSPQTPNLGKNRRIFSRVTLKFDRWPEKKNNSAPLLCDFKHCASFHSHLWIQTEVTIQKLPIWVKFDDYFEPCDLETFLSRVILKFDGWLWKTIGHLFYATSSFVLHFIAICEFKLEWIVQSGNGYIGFWPLTFTFDLWLWPLAWTWPFSVVITPENCTMIRRQEHSEKCVTDRQTDRQTCLVAAKTIWIRMDSESKTKPHDEPRYCHLKCPKPALPSYAVLWCVTPQFH